MSTVVGVHGAFHELWGPHQLESRWLPALRDGLWHHGVALDNEEFSMAFYGDFFRADVEAGHPDLEELIEIAQDTGLVDLADSLYGPGGLEALAAEIGAVVLRRLIDQLARYFADDGLRAAVQERLVEVVTPQTKVIVAHSMGTIVAYEALCDHPEWGVTTLITMGSPLGGPFVFDRLRPAPQGGLGAWPGSITHWTNVVGVRDTVVNEPQLAIFFGVDVADRLVDNGHRSHDAEPYLNAAVTGAAIAAQLTAD